MTDVDHAIGLIQSGKLTIDQVLLFDQSGLLRPLPNQGVRVLVIGSIAGYLDQHATFHSEIAAELVRRGVAAYT